MKESLSGGGGGCLRTYGRAGTGRGGAETRWGPKEAETKEGACSRPGTTVSGTRCTWLIEVLSGQTSIMGLYAGFHCRESAAEVSQQVTARVDAARGCQVLY